MTIGAVIFAQNNDIVDYIGLANHAASKIIKHLEIPVSLITNDRNLVADQHNFDQIIDIKSSDFSQTRLFNDGAFSSKKTTWDNFSRSDVYHLTPYDRTLVIDSDFIINSKLLKPALTLESNFQIYKKGFDLAAWRNNSEFNRINRYGIPFYWATVFVFDKDPIVESFFNLVNYIKNNLTYFKLLYGLDFALFRNDHAFSLAIHLMNDQTDGMFASELPGKLSYILDKDKLIKIDNDTMTFLIEKQNHVGEYILATTSALDMHVMNKLTLNQIINGTSNV